MGNSLRYNEPIVSKKPLKTPVKLKDCLDSIADALGHADLSCAASALAADELLRNNDVFLFDCDGVIWKGDVAIPGAVSVIARLRALGKLLFFITNNSTKSRAGLLTKFHNLGFDVRPEEVLCSSFAVAVYLKKNPVPAGEKVYVIGVEGITEELNLMQIPNFGGISNDHNVDIQLRSGVKIEHDPDVAAVVVGFDPSINYFKIQYAQLCINNNENCRFIATNTDCVGHVTDAQEWAEAGAMVGAVSAAVERDPIVVGKPSSILIDYLTDQYSVRRDRMCMVGDRLDTDVLFGALNGMRTVLTLSGTTTFDSMMSVENKIIPDYYVDSIADICVLSRKSSLG